MAARSPLRHARAHDQVRACAAKHHLIAAARHAERAVQVMFGEGIQPDLLQEQVGVLGRGRSGDPDTDRRDIQNEAERVRETLSEQIGNSVRWLDSVLYLLDQPAPRFEEVGPGTVLTKLVAQIKRKRPNPRTPEPQNPRTLEP